MDQLKGFVVPGKENLVCLHIHLHGILEELGFQKNITSDVSIFIKCHNGGDPLIILVYVDDITIFGVLEDIKSFKTHSATCYKVTNLGEASQFLGLCIACNHLKKILTIDQSHCIQRMLIHFNMLQCQLVYTPFAAGTKLISNIDPDSESSLTSRY